MTVYSGFACRTSTTSPSTSVTPKRPIERLTSSSTFGGQSRHCSVASGMPSQMMDFSDLTLSTSSLDGSGYVDHSVLSFELIGPSVVERMKRRYRPASRSLFSSIANSF